MKKLVYITITIILLCILVLLFAFRGIIFKKEETGTAATTVKLKNLPSYKDNVKLSEIERISIISQSTNITIDSKEDIKKAIKFIEEIKGTEITEGYSQILSNTYGVIIYSKDNTKTVLTISPLHFRIDEEKYYKSEYNYYTMLQELINEL